MGAEQDDTWRFAALADALRVPVRRISYEQARRDATQLAIRLRETLGISQLAAAHWDAIPRGGLFVLGMLSYLLELPPSRLKLHGSGGPLVLVDDCCLTGSRVASALAERSDEEVIVAHLYSPPALRAEIVRQEPRVRHCVAGADLMDHLERLYPAVEARSARQERWRSRFPGRRYWVGIPDILVLPWAEPDCAVSDPLTGELGPGWSYSSPSRCLKTRALLEIPLWPDVTPEWESAEPVAFLLIEDRVLLCRTDTGDCLSLRGPAADIWKCLATLGSVAAACDFLVERFDAPAERIREDVCQVLESLTVRGFLVVAVP